MNEIWKKDHPQIFVDLFEAQVELSLNEHRRGGSFIRRSIIEWDEDSKQYYPEIENFDQYIGIWETNDYFWDDMGGPDEIVVLRRVKPYSNLVEVRSWVSDLSDLKVNEEDEYLKKSNIPEGTAVYKFNDKLHTIINSTIGYRRRIVAIKQLIVSTLKNDHNMSDTAIDEWFQLNRTSNQ